MEQVVKYNPAFNSKALTADSLESIFANDLTLKEQTPSKQTFIQKIFRKKFIQLFNQIDDGYILVDDPIEQLSFGSSDSELQCHIRVNDINTYTKLALAGSNGSSEAYIEGLWQCDNPTNLIRVLLRNRKQLDRMETGVAKFAQFLYQNWHKLNKNSKTGSKKNIAAHYDLGNQFFRLFLDKRMMYSSALYSKDEDLETASDRKLQRICDTLEINQSDNIVEIGSGWGGFACYAAATTGCKVTTITISQEQFEEAKARVQRESLGDLVTVKLVDYRDIDGQYDKLVSIEMIEAVGHQYLAGYFNKINQLLKPGGRALIQAIVIDDERYQQALKEVDYIKRFIFPGSFIPCYSLIKSTASDKGLTLEEIHDMGSSYALTLLDWRKRFYQQIDAIDQLGYDDKFKRMWEFYLCYCEGGFAERSISVGQILFKK